jgi:hypothetical protein
MAKQTYTTGQVLTAAQMTALQANDYNWTVSAKTASYVLVAADAGTRITMSNAGATTITVNTALFTAGDTLTITNIGAGACTITAGTATVSTAGSLILNQYDSGTLYFSSTSAAIWNGANPGDITGVTAGTGISGGGTSGTVTITNSMATEITAKGDLIAGTGSATFDNLPVGTNGQTLVADSTASTGLKWATPSSTPTFVGCWAKANADTTCANAVKTLIALATEVYDTDGFHSNVTNNSRITIPSGKAGYYSITGTIRYNTNSTGARAVSLYYNGAEDFWVEQTSQSGVYPTVQASYVKYLAATDYVQLYAYQASGGSLDARGAGGNDYVGLQVSYLGV